MKKKTPVAKYEKHNQKNEQLLEFSTQFRPIFCMKLTELRFWELV